MKATDDSEDKCKEEVFDPTETTSTADSALEFVKLTTFILHGLPILLMVGVFVWLFLAAPQIAIMVIGQFFEAMFEARGSILLIILIYGGGAFLLSWIVPYVLEYASRSFRKALLVSAFVGLFYFLIVRSVCQEKQFVDWLSYLLAVLAMLASQGFVLVYYFSSREETPHST